MFNTINKNTRFVFVVGGVLSGLGKGVVTASIARLIKDSGYKVNVIKIDPYVNVDAGTMRPTEHGEVFVTNDGGEVDQDLGTYERFLDQDMSKDNNITTGKVYLRVIQKERSLKYGGRDVKLIPDVVNEVKEMILNSSMGYDVVLVEVGGTTGDIENLIFLHAIRQLMQEFPSVAIMVVYAPLLKNIGELKTKPAQHAVAKLREVGIFPDFIVVRSETGLDTPRIKKIATNVFLSEENIIDSPDTENIYEVPLIFEKQNFISKILEKLGVEHKESSREWKDLINKIKNTTKKIRIGIVGKYVTFGNAEHKDVYISVIEAIKHAAFRYGIKPKIMQVFSADIGGGSVGEILKDFDGIVVPGGFGSFGVEGKIMAIKYCRENNIPFLGLCFGMQLAVIEFARNVVGLKEANSTEIDPTTPYPVIDILPEQKEVIKEKRYGNSMRLGRCITILKESSQVFRIYGKKEIEERHRHRYEVNPKYIGLLEKHGLIFSGTSPDGKLMEFLELPNHKFFIATQAHPEFKSRLLKPHPLFIAFIKACANLK